MMESSVPTAPQEKQGHLRRILIDHGGYEFRNMGDVGMLQAAVGRLTEFMPKTQFLIFAWEPDRLRAYCPGAVAVPVEGREVWLQQRNLFGAMYRVIPKILENKIAHYEADLRIRHVDWATRRIRKRLGRRGVDLVSMTEFLDAMHAADALVVAGGSFLTDPFAWQADRILETVRLATALSKPVALFGQGLGPLENPVLRHKMREAFRGVQTLGLREERYSRHLLRQIGVSQDVAKLTGDDTVELVYQEKRETLGAALGVNMRFARYSGLSLREVGEVRRVIALFAYKMQIPVYGIPISRHAGDSDVATAELLLRSLPTTRDCGTTLNSPRAVIRQISECRVVLTGAYHGAVYALAQGIPVVALVKSPYYRNKFEGLRDQYEEGCIVLYFDQPDLPHQLEAALYRQWKAAPQLRDNLLAVAKNQITKVRQLYERFCLSISGHSPSIEAV